MPYIRDNLIDQYMEDEMGLMGGQAPAPQAQQQMQPSPMQAPIPSGQPPTQAQAPQQPPTQAQAPQQAPQQNARPTGRSGGLMYDMMYSPKTKATHAAALLKDQEAWDKKSAKAAADRQFKEWGSGVKDERVRNMVMSENPKIREAGLKMYGQKPDKDNEYTNVRYDEQTGRSYGLNQDGQYEQIQGRSGTAKPRVGDAPMNKTEQFKAEREMRKSYDRSNAQFNEQRRSMDNIRSSYNVNDAGEYVGTGPGDVALISGFQKMLDPGSVVRETEFAQAQDTAGLYNRLKGMLRGLETGETLSTDARKQMVQLMDKYWDATNTHMVDRRSDYISDANEYGLSPKRVVGSKAFSEYENSRAPQPQAPAPRPAPAPAPPRQAPPRQAPPSSERGPQRVQGVEYPVTMVNQQMGEDGVSIAKGNDGKFYFKEDGVWREGE